MMTRLFVHVRPDMRSSDLLDSPSTSTQCTRPISSALAASAPFLCASMTSASRRFFTSSGTSSVRCLAAAVLSLMLYANMNAFSYPTRRMRLTVSACSSSVSPQKPEMKSLDSATPGISLRARSTRSRYASLVYPRRIRSSTELEPLCAGTCSCFATLALDAMTRKTSSGKSLGCGDVKRTRISGSTSATASSNSANRTAPSLLGLYTLLNPGA
mmetsp:Transcript_5906/g.24191  ORF Transcript_5906/g.24191 Transcript_5906/m.24191 type:complete len:214 (-) Transcript_5906:1070-1711(-)